MCERLEPRHAGSEPVGLTHGVAHTHQRSTEPVHTRPTDSRHDTANQQRKKAPLGRGRRDGLQETLWGVAVSLLVPVGEMLNRPEHEDEAHPADARQHSDQHSGRQQSHRRTGNFLYHCPLD